MDHNFDAGRGRTRTVRTHDIDLSAHNGDDWSAAKKPAADWKKILLLIGLGTLSWISTYTGMLELIQANMGEVSLTYKAAIGFAVAMLMLMIIWLLDQLFARNSFVVRTLFITGYLFLTVISVGFGFGFYWKFLESRSEASRSAESAVTQVQSSLEGAQTRLEQLLATLTTLSTVSQKKAVDEREKGNSCPNSRPGDGPRRRLRDADARRFAFAAKFVDSRVGSIKKSIAALNADLARVVSRDKSTVDAKTGTRNNFLRALNRKLDGAVVRFNAFRTDPQLRQLRGDFNTRAEKTVFADGKGGSFRCPDAELQQALKGVVRAIDKLPSLEKPKIAAVEGSEAIIEAFRRMTTTIYGVVRLELPPTPEQLRAQQQRAIQSIDNMLAYRKAQETQAGLGKRDYVPLLIALFVDFCLLLVSVSRPMNRFQALIPKMREAQDGPIIQILSRFHDIHADEDVRQKFEVFRHVVFDYMSDYYVAVPLKAPELSPADETEHAIHPDRLERRQHALQLEATLLANLFTSFEADRVFKRVAWPNGVIARRRLRRQGSKFSESQAFRIYRFNDGAWSEMILGAIMGAAKRVEAAKRKTALEDQLFRSGEPSLDPGFLNGAANDDTVFTSERHGDPDTSSHSGSVEDYGEGSGEDFYEAEELHGGIDGAEDKTPSEADELSRTIREGLQANAQAFGEAMREVHTLISQLHRDRPANEAATTAVALSDGDETGGTMPAPNPASGQAVSDTGLESPVIIAGPPASSQAIPTATPHGDNDGEERAAPMAIAANEIPVDGPPMDSEGEKTDNEMAPPELPTMFAPVRVTIPEQTGEAIAGDRQAIPPIGGDGGDHVTLHTSRPQAAPPTTFSLRVEDPARMSVVVETASGSTPQAAGEQVLDLCSTDLVEMPAAAPESNGVVSLTEQFLARTNGGDAPRLLSDSGLESGRVEAWSGQDSESENEDGAEEGLSYDDILKTARRFGARAGRATTAAE